METEFGTFLQFEPITLVPFDLDGIDKTLLTKEEKDKLNEYHDRVYKKVSPFLTEKEAKFLKKYTKAI
jgi:Xaa-Pro aminopeptidase